MKSLFPYQGGKSKIAGTIWEHFKGIKNYIEPFCGSAAVLLNKPEGMRCTETINDLDGFVVNLYRAIKYHPDEVAHYADWPVSELDTEARHHYLCKQYSQTDFINNMRINVEFCDPKSAGYWLYGACIWLGQGWCSDKALSKYKDGDPDIVKNILSGKDYKNREYLGAIPLLGNSGVGINRTGGTGINRVNREDFGRLPHLGNPGKGINRVSAPHAQSEYVYDMMNEYCDRLRKVRIVCGDWKRVLTPSCTYKHGQTGVFLDPPYDQGGYTEQYGYRGKEKVWPDVVAWCQENQDNPKLTIALCGHEGGWEPDTNKWQTIEWTRNRGYSTKENGNRFLERIWISNSKKLTVEEESLFEDSIVSAK